MASPRPRPPATRSRAFASQGGTVMLITNAPRPGEVVRRFLDKLGVPRTPTTALSARATSRARSWRRGRDKAVFHIGPERDLPIFDGLGLNFVPWSRPTMSSARACATTRSKPRRIIAPSSASCAPRDVHAVRQSRPRGRARREADLLRRCAGRPLRHAGRRGAYAGKPHRPIYDLALERVPRCAAARRRASACWRSANSVRTDLKGATISASTACS